MILQCDQCSTKFRLDESKLKPGGVKVRCSKCRHVFLAGAEQNIEESEFDSILSGLGAHVSQNPAVAEPARREESLPGLAEEAVAAQGHPGELDILEGAGYAPGATFDFDELFWASEPDAALDGATPTVAKDLAFNDFDYNTEPVMPPQDAAPAVNDELDFGEFSFDDPPAVVNTPVSPSVGKNAFDFGGGSSFEESGSNKVDPCLAKSEAADLDEFSIMKEPVLTSGEPIPALPDSSDLGEFSFTGGPIPTVRDALDFGEFSFSEEPSPGVAGTLDETFSFPEEPKPVDKGELAKDDFFALGDFVFPDITPEQAVNTEGPAPSPKSAVTAPTAVQAAEYQQHAASNCKAMDAKKNAQEATLDINFDVKPLHSPVLEGADEDLSPLIMSSRRKGRSLLTVSIVAVSVIIIIALTGAGLYLLQSGPVAMYRFESLGLGFVAKWFGMESPEEGRIAIRNPLAAFHLNKEAGEIFVVTGEVVNSYKKSRASIHVKVSLFDKKGAVLLQKTAYCGNKLSNEQLETLTMAKMESIMNNQFGDSLANLGVQPGHAIGFVVAMDKVPKEAVDFGVEVAGSTVAGQ